MKKILIAVLLAAVLTLSVGIAVASADSSTSTDTYHDEFQMNGYDVKTLSHTTIHIVDFDDGSYKYNVNSFGRGHAQGDGDLGKNPRGGNLNNWVYNGQTGNGGVYSSQGSSYDPELDMKTHSVWVYANGEMRVEKYWEK